MSTTHCYKLNQPFRYEGKKYAYAEIIRTPKVRDRITATSYVNDTFGESNADAILCGTLASVSRFATNAECDQDGNPTTLHESTKLPIDTLIDELDYNDFTNLVMRMSGKSFLDSPKENSGAPSMPSAEPDMPMAKTS